MSVWFAIPSCRPLTELDPVLEKWKAQGYQIALLRQGEPTRLADFSRPTPTYRGWAPSVNELARRVLQLDSQAQWIVTGGDDYWPDSNHTAEEIAAECNQHFGGTFGVMQPTGDRWGADEDWAKQQFPGREAYLDRIAGSPWLGREWCLRAYLGNGPMWPYAHCWADEELQEVAIKLNAFWQRRDLIQYHDHHTRGAHAAHAGVQMIAEDYHKSRAQFEARKQAGWPGSQIL